MKGNISVAWLLAAAVALSSCGSDGSQYVPLPPGAPDGLSYPDPNMFTQGVTITPLVPTLSTGTATNYMVTPDLPAGLKLGFDGRISGTPTEPRAPATYLVTAGNASGTTSFGVRITVVGRFTIGGTVSGLTGTGLVLTNNGGDDLAVNANGEFTFPTALGAGAGYSVAVATQPSGQACSVSGGKGFLANDNYGRVMVSCSANAGKFTIAAGTLAGRFAALHGGDPARVLYVACTGRAPLASIRGYIVDRGTNLVTPLSEPVSRLVIAPDASSPARCDPNSIGVDPDGHWLYVTDTAAGVVFVYANPGPIDQVVVQ